MENVEREFLGVWIPREIYLHKNLTPTEKLLLAEIKCLSKNGVCFASNEHFSDFLGISKKHVSKLITKLARMGLVTVDLTYKEGTKEVDKRLITPILIEAHTPPHVGVDPHLADEYTPTHSGVDPILVDEYYKEHIKIQSKEQVKDNKKINKKSNSAELEAEFETLWKLYPRKEGKTAAKKHYIKARKDKTSYETVENGLYRYKEHLEQQGTESQFIPYGSSWFCQERWNDEYVITATKSKKMSLMDMYRRDFGGEKDGFARNTSIFDYDESGISERLPQSNRY
jgi:Mn-dependent DtxR family transcriptional regulator